MKFRLVTAGLFALLLASCSTRTQSFGVWIRSPESTERIRELAAAPKYEGMNSQRKALLSEIVGDGTQAPLAALESYFGSIPTDKVEGAESQHATEARYFLDYVTSGKKFTKDISYESALIDLWALQVFRTKPLDERVKLSKRPSVLPYVDPAKKGSLLPFEENRDPKTAEAFSKDLSFIFAPTSETMRRFQDAILPLG
jgi:hypothetical protein